MDGRIGEPGLPAEEEVKLKFRLKDGTEFGHGTFTSPTTIATVRERAFRTFPEEGTLLRPQEESDLTLGYRGRVLNPERTIAQLGINLAGVPGEFKTIFVIVMTASMRKNIIRERYRSQRGAEAQTRSCTAL